MKKIKIISILLMLSVYSYAINIEIRFGQSTSDIFEEKVKNDIKELLEKQLGFFQETYIVDINDKDIESFENSLRKRNKRFLQEYSKENKIDIMITLNYKKSSKSIQSRVFLNDEQNSEKNNYTLVTKIIVDDKKTQIEFKPKSKKEIFVNKNDTYNDRKIYAISICSSIMQNLNELNVLKHSKGKI